MHKEILASDIGLGPVVATGYLCVPGAVSVLVFDGMGFVGDTLLGDDAAGGRQGGVAARKGFREHIVELVGPAAVVLNDLVVNLRQMPSPR